MIEASAPENSMCATLDQVDSFREFARRQLADGGADLTIDELFDRWRDECEIDATLRAVERSRAEFEEGRSQTLEEADTEIRRQLGFAPRRR
jgi:hypothetical protein